jgi:alpha-galactosidase
MRSTLFVFRLACLVVLCLAWPLRAQVDYSNNHPWNQKADSGPDAEVPGWFYNLGITGLRARLVPEEPKALLIKYIFPKSPAAGLVEVGDLIIGAGGALFKEDHRNGYGEAVFGADGPISELAAVLEECQSADRGGKLALTLKRGQTVLDITLDVGTKYGTFAPTFPMDCPKSEMILGELLQYLVDNQQEDGSFGNPVHDTFAPLALLSSGLAKYRPAVERNMRHHVALINNQDLGLRNWYYMNAAIVLSEYYLATGEKWVLPELQKVHDLIAKGQYLSMSQINPKAKESHPDSFPKGPETAHGGWGHNPGFEGYGPIAMITGQGALAYSLMHRCGITIDRANHDAAYAFIKRGTGENGYVWYGDSMGGGPNNWADMGRTGAAAIAYFLSPYADAMYRERALLHARVIGLHPQSFPDTHGSPAMGMGYSALGAAADPDSFRKLMDANRWWFTMAQCTDGSFYYQPNRDNAGYGSDSRMTASSVTAFMLSIHKRGLVLTGREQKVAPPPVRKAAAGTKPLKVYILAGQSNMQGHAAISTFDSLATDPKTAPLLTEMRTPDGAPRTCERVWISSIGCLGDAYSDLTEAKGTLTAGFGAPEDKIGPEFTFGIVMEKALDAPILIIKTAWGGRSLHTDFRPPSAGPYVWSAFELDRLKERDDDLSKVKAEKVKETGVYYREMVRHVKHVLTDIKRVVPSYDERQGYELAGFVWFQGFNDYVSGWTYDKQMEPGGYDLYADLLGHFIRDVRRDLSAPKMPFVIGVMGIDGMRGDNEAPMMHFRIAQRKPTTLEEFKGNVIAVETAPFWDDDLDMLHQRMERLGDTLGAQFNQTPAMTEDEKELARQKAIEAQFTPEELRRLRAGVSNGGYHYLGAAKIMAPIGRAYAEALIGAKPAKE